MTLINTFWFLVVVVISAFSSTINFRTAYLFGAKTQIRRPRLPEEQSEAALIIIGIPCG